MPDVGLRDARPGDAGAIARIYNHYIAGSIATFEEDPVTDSGMAERVRENQDAGFPWLVAAGGGDLVGYAYAGPWNSRCAYRHTAECSVYLAPDATGRGLGKTLYRELFQRLEPLEIKVLIGGISLPNAPSEALHEGLGFRKVAHFERVGFKFGRWIDVGYWQRDL